MKPRAKGRRRPRDRATLTATVASAALAAALVATPSVAAASQPFAGQQLTVLIPAPSTNVANVNAFNTKVAEAFDAATGARLTYSTYTSSSEEITTIETAAVSGNGPDVMNLGTTVVPTAYATHDFAVLSAADWAMLGGQSAFFAQQLKMGGPNPNTYIGVPIDAVPFVMAYNTLLFKKAGITSAPTTWSEYVADAQKINDPAKGIYGTGFDPADSFDPWKDYWTFALQDGGNFVSPNLKKAELDSPPMVNAVQFWFDWYTQFKIVNPQSLTWKGADLVDAFAAGKVGEIPIQTINSIPVYEAGAIGNHFAFAPPPSVPYGLTKRPTGGQPASTIVSGQDDVIAKYANKALALDYLKVLTSVSTQEEQYKMLKELPVKTAAARYAATLNPTIVKPFINSLENADPTAFVGAWGPIEAALAGATVDFATKIVSTHKLPLSYVNSVLKSANAQAQSQL